jgi:hypothetical protein
MQSPPVFQPELPVAGNSAPSWMDDRFMTGDADLDWHQKNTSDLSLREYVDQKRRELAKSIIPKKRIYLDQRYWIQCREAERGCGSVARVEIWTALLKLVRAGSVVCPIAFSSVVETYKQADPSSRRRTAEVMDELSTGVALRSFAGRRQAEFALFVARLTLPVSSPLPPLDQAFSWPFEVFGEMRAANEPRSIAMGKAAFDAFCRMRFPDVLSAMPSMPEDVFQRACSSAASHNRLAATNSGARWDYGERLRREIRSVCQRLSRELRPAFPACSEATARLLQKRCEATMLKRHEGDQFKHDLPSEYIRAAIYAAVDHKRRPYHEGDLFDHEHAIAALPYCDFFFTEGTLGTLLTEKPARLDSVYGCCVLWNDDDIISALRFL